MWTLVVFALSMIGLALLVTRLTRKDQHPQDTYICDVCGEKECICHKEEKG